MTVDKAIRWWPPLGVLALLVLGWMVGNGSTPLDDWFLQYRHSPAAWLLFFTDEQALAIVLAAAVGVGLYRRQWRLAVVMVASPPIAVAIVDLCKPVFERQKGGALAYPSGHTTVTVVVMGMVVLVAGAALWAVAAAVAVVLLGVVGQAVTYHYFTDAVGAVFLASAIVCIAARAAGCLPVDNPEPAKT